MASVAGVTMFFNLKPLSDTSTQTRSSDFYQKNSVATLSANIPLVVLCDETTLAWIEPLRKSLSDKPTHYIVKNITDYDHYKINHPIVVRNRIKSVGYKNKDDRNTGSYLLTTSFKIHAIQMASEIYPDASHYFWIDFGCAHVVWEAKERLNSIFENPKPKVAMTYIHYRSSSEISNMESFLASGGPCSLAGTVFSVEKSYVDLFYSRCLALFYEMLARGVGHNDEQIFMYLFERYPEMFTLIYGDYYSVISNYNYIVRDYWSIRWHFIQNALNAGRKDLAANAAKSILDSQDKGTINIGDVETAFLKSLL